MNPGRWGVLKLAVVGLIITGSTTVACVTLLISQGREAPDGLIAIASASIGALATLMVSTKDDGGAV